MKQPPNALEEPVAARPATTRALALEADRLIELGVPESVAIDSVARAMAIGMDHVLRRVENALYHAS